MVIISLTRSFYIKLEKGFVEFSYNKCIKNHKLYSFNVIIANYQIFCNNSRINKLDSTSFVSWTEHQLQQIKWNQNSVFIFLIIIPNI